MTDLRTHVSRALFALLLTPTALYAQDSPDPTGPDPLALEEIAGSIDASVEAWEKRGYWVKADRFRLDWEWAGSSAAKLRSALAIEDWGSVAMAAVTIAQKLGKVTVPVRHRLGTPWVGAYQSLKKQTKTAS